MVRQTAIAAWAAFREWKRGGLLAQELGWAIAGLALLGSAALLGGPEATPAPGIVTGPTRERAMSELRNRVKDADRLSHAVAVEGIMKELARACGGAPEEWGLAGLLHDIDLAETKAEPSRHGVVGARLLAKLGFSEAVVHAVEAHDDAASVPRRAPIDHALHCADRAYWAVRSSGLSFPSAEAAPATPASVVEGLARRGASDRIDLKLTQTCEAAGLTLDEALRLSLVAMRAVSESVQAAPRAPAAAERP